MMERLAAARSGGI